MPFNMPLAGQLARARGPESELLQHDRRTPTRKAAKCGYLDSQADIEAVLPPDAIVRTDITVTCPLVSVVGVPVGP